MARSYFKRFGVTSRTGPLLASSVLGASCLVVYLPAPTALQAQEFNSTRNYRFSVTQSLRATDNIRLSEDNEGTTYSTDTDLSFGYRIGTGVQSLSLSASTTFRLQDDPIEGSSSGLTDADLGLTYQLSGANSNLLLQSRFVRTDLGFSNPLDEDELNEEDLSNSIGHRDRITNSLNLELGQNSALGLLLGVSQSERRFGDTTDDDLFDTQTNSVQTTLPWRLSTTTDLRLAYTFTNYTADDDEGTNRDTKRLTIGIDHNLSATTNLSFDISSSEVRETFDNLPGVEDVEDGLVLSAALSHRLPNGSVSLSANNEVTQVGRRSRLAIERALSLPQGSLTFSIGAVEGESTDLRPTGSLQFNKDLKNANFTAGFSSNSSVSSSTSDVTETTRFNLGYNMQINALSSLSLGLGYANVEDLDSDESDRRRHSFDVSWVRNVTEDWNFTAGYQYRYARTTTGSSGESNAVFFTLKRDFGGL